MASSFQEQEMSSSTPLTNSKQYTNLDTILVFEAEPNLRQAFVSKVFSLLSLQLFITFGSIIFFSFNASARHFLAAPDSTGGASLILLSSFLLIFATFGIICCPEFSTRRHPHNLIFLGIYTFSQSILLSAVAIDYDLNTLMLAVGVTWSLTAGLAIFAKKTSMDFATYSTTMYLFSFLWSMLIFGFIMIFVQSRIMELIYAFLGTILFSFYIIYDVQMIVGGRHGMEFSVDDYVVAALMLYIDIIQIFIFILRLLADSSDRNGN